MTPIIKDIVRVAATIVYRKGNGKTMIRQIIYTVDIWQDAMAGLIMTRDWQRIASPNVNVFNITFSFKDSRFVKL